MIKFDYTADKILMNAKFPSQQKVCKDESITSEVELLKKLVNVIRKTRSDLNVHPRTLIDIYCIFSDNMFEVFLKNNEKIISSLVKSNGINICCFSKN